MQESAGWTNQYTLESSVVGEAPEVCEALGTHYRHACGRFQTFWSPQCPLLQPGLTALQRAAYASDCLHPLASGVSPRQLPQGHLYCIQTRQTLFLWAPSFRFAVQSTANLDTARLRGVLESSSLDSPHAIPLF